MGDINITFDGAAKVLKQISEANGTSEYLLRESDKEFRMKVRHSKEKGTGGSPGLDRHSIELTVRTFPTATLPAGSTESVYAVIRSNPNSDGTFASKIAATLSSQLNYYRDKLIGWQII